MKKLSLIVALIVCVNANENLSDALINGNFRGEIKAWYWDRTQEANPYNNENITNFGLELGYKTGSFYDFYFGTTAQMSFAPISDKNAKDMFDIEQNTKGVVFSELYLGYNLSKTDIKIGRQFINTPLVAGNYARFFKESFQGATIKSSDLSDTTLFAGYIDRFQGRTSSVMGDSSGSEPIFRKRVTIGGLIAKSYEFDGAAYVGFSNKSIDNVTLTTQYVFANNVKIPLPNIGNKNGDIHMYFGESSYVIPFDNFDFKVDISIAGSEVEGSLNDGNLDGKMFGAKAGIYKLKGFDLYSAFHSVLTDNDSMLYGLGLGANTYTAVLIRGPYASFIAGMDTYKFGINYNFDNIGINGLNVDTSYFFSNHDAPVKNTGIIPANMKWEYSGYNVTINYNLKQAKGFATQVVWTSIEDEKTFANGKKLDTDFDELWLKLSYKF
ncbi:metalloid reductase RarA [Campylobacter sputorum subsp. bubulus]|uniref:Metalloid reductase RarA n=1 Tax=Campylobacter sputorum subsp. sputorum TaxID=32024 RepID=A0A381DJY6_9BACT|nr:OprD family outer membrane porin [Campylobacter sputorum]ASM34320.1 outer membrane porin, OprD family [Campylobacter sputorum aubsp. sputorum RM3237]KAB0582287.1 OprD family porin [Campylobacter sputorum subsp. sputorum]QEL04511.1 outer membrane porin, OprD family [Campylobacter sputorum subsp. sputorum]SUX09284.1 metalloid reductase RarA [Campylobacter sputorum subsp. bubulus]SUX10976.1 metalloid reductase RarA [Campylobacter sputorum subsp. sputorum]